jgi:hypothetical protein
MRSICASVYCRSSRVCRSVVMPAVYFLTAASAVCAIVGVEASRQIVSRRRHFGSSSPTACG